MGRAEPALEQEDGHLLARVRGADAEVAVAAAGRDSVARDRVDVVVEEVERRHVQKIDLHGVRPCRRAAGGVGLDDRERHRRAGRRGVERDRARALARRDGSGGQRPGIGRALVVRDARGEPGRVHRGRERRRDSRGGDGRPDDDFRAAGSHPGAVRVRNRRHGVSRRHIGADAASRGRGPGRLHEPVGPGQVPGTGPGERRGDLRRIAAADRRGARHERGGQGSNESARRGRGRRAARDRHGHAVEPGRRRRGVRNRRILERGREAVRAGPGIGRAGDGRSGQLEGLTDADGAAVAGRRRSGNRVHRHGDGRRVVGHAPGRIRDGQNVGRRRGRRGGRRAARGVREAGGGRPQARDAARARQRRRASFADLGGSRRDGRGPRADGDDGAAGGRPGAVRVADGRDRVGRRCRGAHAARRGGSGDVRLRDAVRPDDAFHGPVPVRHGLDRSRGPGADRGRARDGGGRLRVHRAS